ncbi:MAG: DUF4445 domain-containing protein, partial [Phascolarctobacterium sp.]|nr:DUF4445 domain-containing protein [Phascolarctobacterium sp.]
MSTKIKINGKSITVNKGEKISQYLDMDFPCGGHGKCGKCKVKIKGSHLPYGKCELELLSKDEIEQGVHLACVTNVQAGMEIESIPADIKAKNKIISTGIMPDFSCQPNFSKYGVAVDIGTTTIVARLYDSNGNAIDNCSMLNPQAAWGADVISRIEAALTNEASKITQSTLKAIDTLVTEMCNSNGLSNADIQSAVITGNTVMLSLLTGTSVKPLSCAPFLCERLFGETVSAKDLGLSSINPEVQVYLPNCAAAFIGADIVTALLASDICSSESTQLLVDIGTNGEMALWHKGKLYFCSTAAGPAFEGVGIYMGMPSKSGAIDRVEIVDGQMIAHTIDDAKPCGICGSGIVDAIACLLKMDLIDETGYLEDSVTIASPVILKPNDIRAVQLSKSAICAGMYTLINEAGISCDDIEKVHIAGGFGSYINIE